MGLVEKLRKIIEEFVERTMCWVRRREKRFLLVCAEERRSE